MALQDSLRSLNELDINDLNFENIGSWPGPVKFILCVLLLAGVIAGGYYYHVEDLQLQLQRLLLQQLDEQEHD